MATLWEVTHPDHALALVMKAPLLAFDLQHPEQIALTARAIRAHRDSYFTSLKRRFNLGALPPDPLG